MRSSACVTVCPPETGLQCLPSTDSPHSTFSSTDGQTFCERWTMSAITTPLASEVLRAATTSALCPSWSFQSTTSSDNEPMNLTGLFRSMFNPMMPTGGPTNIKTTSESNSRLSLQTRPCSKSLHTKCLPSSVARSA